MKNGEETVLESSIDDEFENIALKATGAGELTVIKPGRASFSKWFKEAVKYRELLYILVWRNLKVKYKQTMFGAAWVIVKPLISLVVFTFVFGRWAKVPSDGIPYPIFTYVALLPWTFFSGTVVRCTDGLVRNSNLLTKIYFPPIIILAAEGIVGAVDFLASIGVLALLMIYYDVSISFSLLAFPVLIMFIYIISLSIGMIFASLDVRFRDISFVVSFLMQTWMFLTPVLYSSSLFPERLQFLLFLNPMVGFIDGFRWSILGLPFPAISLALAAIITLILFIFGNWYFRKTEYKFADII